MNDLEPGANGPLSQETRNWAMFCHVGGFAGLSGIPFANIIVPLVIWRMKRDLHPFVEAHGVAALNFQISWTLYAIACLPFVFLLIGIPMLFALGIAALIFMIMAIIASSDGRPYTYPLSIQFVKPRHG